MSTNVCSQATLVTTNLTSVSALFLTSFLDSRNHECILPLLYERMARDFRKIIKYIGVLHILHLRTLLLIKRRLPSW